jgi:hypothetical protein
MPPLRRTLPAALAATGALLSTALAAPAPFGAAAADAQGAKLRSKLPLVVISAPRAIRNDPKVNARMRVIHRPGRRANNVSDRPNEYAGRIGIELRGHSSQMFPKKSYGLELRDRRGEGRDVGVLGMPEDDDWALTANYSDKSLMRNALAYRAARQLTGRYAPHTRHVEVVVNGNYRGVYLLTQPVELGEGRVDAEDGWILELVFGYQALGERRFKSPRTGRPLLFTDPDEPTRAQRRAIRRDVVRFERALYGKRFRHPRRGWRAHADPAALRDYVLLQELFGNQDAFHASTFFHRPPGGRIVFGPLWDYDIAMGNTVSSRFRTPAGWNLRGRPYVGRLWQDVRFRRGLASRWRALTEAGLRQQMRGMVASNAGQLRAAQARNFRRWRILGRYVWPNPVDPRTGRYRPTWGSEVAYLRRWLDGRITWMNRALG